jgi:hypothetical protein
MDEERLVSLIPFFSKSEATATDSHTDTTMLAKSSLVEAQQ